MKTFKVYEVSKANAFNENIWNLWLKFDLPVLMMKIRQFNLDIFWHKVELKNIDDKVVELVVKSLEYNDYTHHSLLSEQIRIKNFIESFAKEYHFNQKEKEQQNEQD